jgi:site-specific recombinase XerD
MLCLRKSKRLDFFRHTFATNLLAKGAGLDFIAGELGHGDTNGTRTYARLPNPQMVALYRKYMG